MPPEDVAIDNPENQWRFQVLSKWNTATDGFFHGQLSRLGDWLVSTQGTVGPEVLAPAVPAKSAFGEEFSCKHAAVFPSCQEIGDQVIAVDTAAAIRWDLIQNPS